MGKFSELDAVVTSLQSAAVAINEAANAIREMFSAPQHEDTPPTAEEKTTWIEPVTFDELHALFSSKSLEGKAESLKALLKKYGCTKLSGLDPENYAAIYSEAEVL
ncbi:MAG: DNA ligase [Ruminococcaceae bacterium]|nr:DNA ligase [Oscillospiraceae bacterium]